MFRTLLAIIRRYVEHYKGTTLHMLLEHWLLLYYTKDLQEHVLVICFPVGLLLGLFFDSEEGGDMFLRNVG
jgi:hypothetical protein